MHDLIPIKTEFVRRQDKEITDSDIIREILEKSPVIRIGLVDNNEAYIVPLNYAYNDGIIYIHSAPEGRKIDLIKNFNIVSFETELPFQIIRKKGVCQWSVKYRSVMGKGTITLENDPHAKKHALDLIMKKYGAKTEPEYDEKSLSKMIIIKLEIISVTGKQSGKW